MGEAAGTATHLALEMGCPPRDIEVAGRQALLRQGGAILAEEDIR